MPTAIGVIASHGTIHELVRKVDAVVGGRNTIWMFADPIFDAAGVTGAKVTDKRVLRFHLSAKIETYDAALFELARLVVRWLNPEDVRPNNMLEVGAEVWFASSAPHYSRQLAPSARAETEAPDQMRAYGLVAALEATHPEACKKMRAEAGSFRSVSAHQIEALGLSPADADYLVGTAVLPS